MKRASRTGPLLVINEGTVLVAPSKVARATWGFGTGCSLLFNPGLLPPTEGSAWHCAQLLPLKVGPRPTPGSPVMAPLTESTSANTPTAELKKACCVAVRPGTELPAPAAPPRGPGSVWANAIPAKRMAIKTRVGVATFRLKYRAKFRRVIRVPPEIVCECSFSFWVQCQRSLTGKSVTAPRRAHPLPGKK